jgi:two-component system sensor histidine kinase PilS (NtrC family)
MRENDTETIFPCPLSRGYGIPAGQAWLLLKVFLVYRFVLVSLFIILYYSQMGSALLNIYDSRLFVISSRIYLIFSVVSVVCISRRLTGYTIQAQLLIITDIIFLTLFMYAYGGINSGIGILLAVSIASAGLLIGGRCALFYAAMASLAVLSEQLYADYRGDFDPSAFNYVHAGMLGASFFTISLLSFVLANRSEQMLQITDKQKQTIANLEELNQYIIQHLQSGIIITNQDQVVQMTNETTLRIMNLNTLPTSLDEISGELALAFKSWIMDNTLDFFLLKLPNQTEIHVRFMLLPTKHEFFYMMSFEDISIYNQRLQQSKLASLGRLTASIAHEIRNPLSAISHAGQLLIESPVIKPDDKRLTQIIVNNSVRVNNIIEEILLLSRRQNSRREKIHLNSWLDSYIKTFVFENAVDSNIFSLIIDDTLPSAMVDVGHLKQIMDNLCHNALKYGSPETGAIIIKTMLVKWNPCVYVIDNGSGISPDTVSHLFEPFFTTSTKGTGLGLYISRELAELNKAHLSYCLTDDNKNCFRLCLLNAEHKLIEI